MTVAVARSRPALTEADQARELAATHRRVTATRWDVQRRLERARVSGDRREFRCLDERLTELDATLRMLNEQREQFRFVSEGDVAAHRDRSFRRAMMLRARASEVGAEARNCTYRGDTIEGTVTTVVLAEPP